MISLSVYNTGGSEVDSIEIDPDEIAPGVNKQLLHDVVVMYESNRRVGTAQTKSRGMVRGSTRKLYRQKGTGRARAGASRTPVRRGGGHAFGKKPKDWSYRLPKKAIRLATRMAVLSKFLDEQVTLLDKISVDEPKTKTVVGYLRTLKLVDVGALLAIEDHDPVLWKSARNIASLRVSPVDALNAYDVLHQRQLVITTAALERFKNGNNGRSPERDESE